MQTSYSAAPTARRVGNRAFTHKGFVASKILNAAMPAGRFLTRNAGDDKAKLPTTSAEVTASGIGFLLFQDSKEPQYPDSANDYAAGELAPVLTSGYVYVYCETAAAFGGSVFVRFTTATDGTDLGQVRNDADTTKAVAAPNCVFDETISGAGIVRVRKL